MKVVPLVLDIANVNHVVPNEKKIEEEKQLSKKCNEINQSDNGGEFRDLHVMK